MFKPSLNITEQIADHLANLIINGQLVGEARIQELKIARELGVSRGSVREALLILERRHLIEIVPRKGAVVNSLSGAEALELVDMLASVERRWFHSLLDHAEIEQTLQASCETLLAMDRAAKSDVQEDLIQARDDFYRALLAPASRYMAGVFECLFPTSQRLICLLLGRQALELYDIARYYRALHSALQTKDAVRLDELLGAFHKRLTLLCAKCLAEPSLLNNRRWDRSGPALSAQRA